MTRWEVHLRSNHRFSNTELDYWLKLFDFPACMVTKKDDEEFYMTSCWFENLEHPNEVRELAKKLMIIMTAFAKIERDTDFRGIEHDEDDFISDIRERVDDKFNLYAYAKPAEVHANVISSKQDVQGGVAVRLKHPERWFNYFLNHLDDLIGDDKIYRALYYFAQDTMWYSLYKAYEIIRDAVGGDSKIIYNNWVKKTELTSFTTCAQYYDVKSGYKDLTGKYGSRHDRVHYERKSKNRPYTGAVMDLPKAKSFMGRLMKKWLESKQPIN